MKKRNLERVLTDPELSESQRKKLHQYNIEKKINGLADASRYVTLYQAAHLAKFINRTFQPKPYEKMTKAEIQEYMASIAHYKSVTPRLEVRRFFAWVHGCPRGDFPACVSWIELNHRYKSKLPEEMLSKDEILAIAKATKNVRDRAIIMSLGETGMRSHELIKLKIRHWLPDKYGGRLQVPNDTKTGGRCVRIIDSLPDLRNWLNMHRNSNDPDAALFPNLWNMREHLGGHSTLALIVKQAVKNSGVTKRVYLHLF
ncbi:MAG: tyrosine-type recombinase/integrase, partial [Candidatus Micrarchaeota archaeon]